MPRKLLPNLTLPFLPLALALWSGALASGGPGSSLPGLGNLSSRHAGADGSEELLVYRNGNLIKGQVERELGHYLVLTPSGSRIVVPVEQVDFVCGSLREAYQLKRERLPAVTADPKVRPTSRIEFFQWCIKQGLFAEAERELTELQTSRLPAGELYAYLRQLHSAMERAELAAAAPPGASSRTVSKENRSPAAQEIVLSNLPPAEPPLPTVQPPSSAEPIKRAALPPGAPPAMIKPVTYEEPTAASPANNALPVPELENLLEQLPTEGVSLYKRRVEPMLFRNCSNTGCHDPEKTRLPLQRLARGEGIPKRMSQQNLIQVLRFAGSGVAGDSALLAAATTAHGGAAKAPLKIDSEQYRLLAAWVERMAPPTAAAGIQPVTSPLFSATGLPAEDLPPADARPLAVAPNAAPPSSPAGGTQPAAPPAQVPEIPSLEAAPDAFVPADPFDPEIFNRRKNPRGPAGSLPPKADR